MTDNMSILLVEDNDLDVEILKRGLARIGATHTLIRARDGIEALEMLKENATKRFLPDPYVVLLDINMPRMNGHEFLEALRKADDLKSARVFVFTTSQSKSDVDEAYRHNANGYIVKPNSASELTAVLQSLKNFWQICEDPSKDCPSTLST